MTGPGTLHQAILDANASPGRDSITFAVHGFGFDLPAITDPVTIDGTLPDGSRATVEGAGGGGFAFDTGSSSSTLQDVVIVRTPVTGGVIVRSGVTDVGVFRITATNARILGSRTTFGRVGDGNLVSGRLVVTSQGNVVVGNEVGVVHVDGSDHLIANNTITSGVLALETQAVTIESNVINLRNNSVGIFVTRPVGTSPSIIRGNTVRAGSFGIAVRGPAQVHGNSLQNNTTGISVDGTAVELARNLISGGTIAIDLSTDGPTPNDPAPDPDTGANNLQNFPVLTSARRSPAALAVAGSLASAPSTPYEIQFFSSPASDPKAHVFIGSLNVTTDATGNVSFQALFTTSVPAAGQVITATATNIGTTTSPGNAPNETSELSAAIVVIEAAGADIPTLSFPALLALTLALAFVAILRR